MFLACRSQRGFVVAGCRSVAGGGSEAQEKENGLSHDDPRAKPSLISSNGTLRANPVKVPCPAISSAAARIWSTPRGPARHRH